MDVTDRKLLQILERDARITYRELSDRLKISIPSIQKRITALERSGIIQRYATNINLYALGGSVVLVHGSSHSDFTPELIDSLGENDSIMTVICGGQNHLLIPVYLRNLSQLDSIVSFIKEVGRMPEPEVLMINQDSGLTCERSNRHEGPDASELTNLDCRIIKAMHDNARMSISDVAAAVGVSSKTVSIRLENMVKKGLVDFHALTFPNLSEDIVAILAVRLKPNAERKKVIEKLRNDSASFVDEDLTFSNAPNLVMFTLVVENISQLFELLARVKKIDEVESVTHDILIYQKYFETWREKILFEKAAKPSRKSSL